jgi:large exoprotein involved in heme utilization and adhesion
LAGVAGSGIVGLEVDGNNLQLSYPAQVQRADISLSDEARVNASGKAGGNIQLSGRHITLTEGSQILSNTQGQALGGTVSVNASDSVQLIGRSQNGKSASGIFVQTLGTGNAGNLTIATKDLIVREGANASVTTRGAGQGGNFSVTASDSVQVIGRSQDGKSASGLFATAEDIGNAGNLTVATKDLIVRDGAQISATTKNSGQGGTVSIAASDSVQLIGRSQDGNNGSGIFVQTLGTGNAGNLTIATKDLIVREGANASVTTRGAGQGGILNVNASNSVQLIGRSADGENASGLFATAQDTGNAGNLTILTKDFTVRDGAQVSANTRSEGQGGTLTVNASNSVQLIGRSANGENASGLFATAQGTGSAGNLTIVTKDLIVQDGATASVNNRGEGQGGILNVNAANSVELIGRSADGLRSSGLIATADNEATGNGGKLAIATGKLIIRDGARIRTDTFGKGNGGEILIQASDSVNISGFGLNGLPSGLFTGTSGTGEGGTISVNTPVFRLVDGAVVNALTTNQGDGGTITLNANTLEALNGGQVVTTTRGSGRAGNIILNVTDSILLSGSDPTFANRQAQLISLISINESAASGLFASTSQNSTGLGGNLKITAGQLIVRDGAEVTTSSLGSGSAGNLSVEADSIFLDNQGKLRAATASGEGGNIRLQVRDLLFMRRHSLISATADNNGNGGNIEINAPFIVAFPGEDSDIIANANRGRGGNINITTNGIFGLEYRQKLTPLSDINASSDFGVNGTVQINTLDVDPSRGLTTLPAELVDASGLVAQGCLESGNQVANSFTVTGSGGLPDNPGDARSSNAVWTDWRISQTSRPNRISHAPKASPRVSSTVATSQANSTVIPLVEATGWGRNHQGEVVLMAGVSSSPDSLGLASQCDRD